MTMWRISAALELGLEFKEAFHQPHNWLDLVFISRLFRKSALGRRASHLAILVFPDEGSVFHAYRLLHYHGISPENLAIVGHGYSSPERVGLMNPFRIIGQKAVIYATLSGVIGIVLGITTFVIGKLEQDFLFVVLASSLVSGLAGAFLGTVFAIFGEGTTASVYHHHLRQGRYLLMMEGSENLVRWGQEVLNYYSTASPH